MAADGTVEISGWAIGMIFCEMQSARNCCDDVDWQVGWRMLEEVAEGSRDPRIDTLRYHVSSIQNGHV
jgi:hypothetical protein